MSNILHSQSDSDRPDILTHVAGNVRRLRQARRLSQAALAENAGISRRMIVGIERDGANVSLSTLDRLAAALGTSLAALIRAPDAPDSRRIESTAWRGADPASRGVLLGSAPASREAELWLWSLAEGETYASEADSGNWHEMLLVIEGRLAIEMADARHDIAAGDFLIFSSAEPYIFVNAGPGAVRFARSVVL
jgi:transcriptional regulator with XRE-family HTH domain